MIKSWRHKGLKVFFETGNQHTPTQSIVVCCSHKVVAVGFNTLCYDAERRGIKPSARIKRELFLNMLPK